MQREGEKKGGKEGGRGGEKRIATYIRTCSVKIGCGFKYHTEAVEITGELRVRKVTQSKLPSLPRSHTGPYTQASKKLMELLGSHRETLVM